MTAFGNAKLAGREEVPAGDLPEPHAKRAPIGLTH